MTRTSNSTSTPRETYIDLFGPTTGDQIRLADTDLFIQVTEDHSQGSAGSGNEVVFGGGKVIRESMGLSAQPRDEGNTADVVITGAVILDHWGVVKADIGIRDGRIVGIGTAGNPAIDAGVGPGLVIGPSTEVIAGNGKIVTAGGVDCHVHFICPQAAETGLGSGMTTLIGGGSGPGESSKATTVTAGPWNTGRMLRSLDSLPVNVLLLGNGCSTNPNALREQLEAGVGGLKIHEDWGATPAVLDTALRVAEETGIQVALHADTLNEAGFYESTRDAINGRTIAVFHAEGAAIAHGVDRHVGSVEVGKMADLVLWEPKFFGVRPHLVLKGGFAAWGAMGDPNAAIPTPQPYVGRPMFGARPSAAAASSAFFVAPGADTSRFRNLGVASELVAAERTRDLTKAHMKRNATLPTIEVDSDTFQVTINGERVAEAPVSTVPMAQRYFLF